MSHPVDISARYRPDFPALHQEVCGHPLAYLDNAASSQHPSAVIEAISNYYEKDHANVHRGLHELSERATSAYEGARDQIAEWIGAKREEVIFTRGTTEGINLVAQCFARDQFSEGDEILISGLEHHSNIVPWQIVGEQVGTVLKVIPVNDSGDWDLEKLDQLITPRTRLIAVNYVSNSLGTINPIDQVIQAAHQRDIPVLIDGAQAMMHERPNMAALGADFFAFSAHKMLGPTGFGVLFGKEALLDAMPPWHGGGDMIETVRFSGSTWNDLPYKFEAGTPNMAGAIGTAAAIKYLGQLDFAEIRQHEQLLLDRCNEQLRDITGFRQIGTAKNKVAIVSFVHSEAHAQDIGIMLNENGIAVRTGHHCTMPLMEQFGIQGTARASFAFYNSVEEADRLCLALQKIDRIFS